MTDGKGRAVMLGHLAAGCWSSGAHQALKGATQLCWRVRLGPPPGTVTHSPSPPSPAVPSLPKDFLAEQPLLAVSFLSQDDRDLPESSHLSLHVTEGLPPLVFPVVETKHSIGHVARVL